MSLTTQDKIGIGQIGLSGLTGLLGGMNNSADQDRATADQRYNDSRDDEFFQLLLQALNNQSGVEQDITQEQLQRSLAFSNANPLGAEQNLQTKGAAGIAGLDLLQNRKLGGGQVNNAANVNTGNLRQTLSPEAANESIRQRRIATAGLDPRAGMEIGGAGSDYASRLFGELQNSQNQRRDNASQAFDMVGDRRTEMAAQQAELAQQSEQKDGPGFWKKLGGVLIPAAGLAANFIPGVGPLASMAIGAASGAAGGAMLGGKKGALAGGIGGGVAAHGLNQLPSQKPSSWQGAPYSGPVQGAQPSIPKAADFTQDIMNQGAIGGGFSPQQPRRGSVTPPTMGVGMQPRGLQPSTLASPTAPKPQMPFQMNPVSSHQGYAPMTLPSSQPQSTLGANRPTAMRAPTMTETLMDNPIVRGIMGTMNTLGAGNPLPQGMEQSAFQQVLGTPPAQLAMLGMGGTMARNAPQVASAPKFTGAATSPRGYAGVSPAQPLPSNLSVPRAPQMNLSTPARRVVQGSSEVFGPRGPQGASLDNQATVSKLMDAYQKHLSMGNKEYAQQVLELAQPFLKGLK